MIAGFKGTYDYINVLSETDMREDLKKIDIPVLVIHPPVGQAIDARHG